MVLAGEGDKFSFLRRTGWGQRAWVGAGLGWDRGLGWEPGGETVHGSQNKRKAFTHAVALKIDSHFTPSPENFVRFLLFK